MIAQDSGAAREAAPNGIERLNGRGLGEAFRQFVIDDPEVALLIDRSGLRDRFAEGLCPLSLSSFHWPLEVTARNFEFRLNGSGILVLGQPECSPTPTVSKLAQALADRIGALRILLASGKVQAFGMRADFVESFVPARLWTRKNLYIEVANGDLCERDEKGNISPIWSSIELRLASAEPAQHQGAVKMVAAPSGKRSPKGREVERIIKERQINVDRLGRKAAAAEVMRHMESPPQLANQIEALEVQVVRISKELAKTS
ncbi:hypothetical protein [Bradyrhizobium sp.]|jgi:hypothetical protein|uniref:hypothetical protein n=1 Tax=Bradyrhizobium sp. TaxID=376 RepID=UPI003C1AFC8B